MDRDGGPGGILSREKGWALGHEALWLPGRGSPRSGTWASDAASSGSWGGAAGCPLPPCLHSMQELICGFQLPSEKALCSAVFPGLCVAAPGLKGPCPAHVSGGSPERPRQRWLTFPELITQAGAARLRGPQRPRMPSKGSLCGRTKLPGGQGSAQGSAPAPLPLPP